MSIQGNTPHLGIFNDSLTGYLWEAPLASVSRTKEASKQMVPEVFKCNCGTECPVEYEPPTILASKADMAPVAAPRSLRHCESGQVLTNAVSNLISFRIRSSDGEGVIATPLVDDF